MSRLVLARRGARHLRRRPPARSHPAPRRLTVPDLTLLVARPASELADVVDRFSGDQGSLRRRYDADGSPEQRGRMREFYRGWRTRLACAGFRRAWQEGQSRLRAARQLPPAPARPARPRRDAPRRHGAADSVRRSSARAAGCAARPEDGRFARRRAARSRPWRSRSTAFARSSTPPVSRTQRQRRPSHVARRPRRSLAPSPIAPPTSSTTSAAQSPTGTSTTTPTIRSSRGGTRIRTSGSIRSLTRYARTLRERVVGFKPEEARAATRRHRCARRRLGREPRPDHRRSDRREGPRRGSRVRDDPLHARGADRHRRAGVRVQPRRDEEGVARDGLRRRLEGGDGEGEGHLRRARQAARAHSRPRAPGRGHSSTSTTGSPSRRSRARTGGWR